MILVIIMGCGISKEAEGLARDLQLGVDQSGIMPYVSSAFAGSECMKISLESDKNAGTIKDSNGKVLLEVKHIPGKYKSGKAVFEWSDPATGKIILSIVMVKTGHWDLYTSETKYHNIDSSASPPSTAVEVYKGPGQDHVQETLENGSSLCKFGRMNRKTYEMTYYDLAGKKLMSYHRKFKGMVKGPDGRAGVAHVPRCKWGHSYGFYAKSASCRVAKGCDPMMALAVGIMGVLFEPNTA